MAERRIIPEETRQGETHPPPLTPEQFEALPEFAAFTAAMRKVIAIPKSELDRKVRAAKDKSPRVGNPHAPGRKPRVCKQES